MRKPEFFPQCERSHLKMGSMTIQWSKGQIFFPYRSRCPKRRGRVRETERETEREMERETERETERGTERDGERYGESDGERGEERDGEKDGADRER